MTPLERIKFNLYSEKEIKIFIKRDDLVHPSFCGNKWRKLKYQLESFSKSDKSSIITWGGIMSNHIYAVSHLVSEQNIPVRVFIPADQSALQPYSFRKSLENGITPHFVSRTEYRQRFDSAYIDQLTIKYPNAMIIPEGGSNPQSLEGIKEMVRECQEQCPQPIDYWVTPVGTGGTMLGIIDTIATGEVWGISAVKGARQTEWIKKYRPTHDPIIWEVLQDYHLGGMGKYSDALIDELIRFKVDYNILLDPIYTGKMVLSLPRLIQQGKIREGSTVVMIHTGGLVGIENFKERYNLQF